MLKYLSIILFTFCISNSVKSQYTFNVVINSDQTDSCGRDVTFDFGGDFSLPFDYYVAPSSAVGYTTTSDHLLFCRGNTLFGFDQNCQGFVYDFTDNLVGEPYFYISDFVFNVGGVSNCDNTLSFVVHGSSTPLIIDIYDNDALAGGPVFTNTVTDSVFTMTGFCLGDFQGTNVHSFSIDIWDAAYVKYTSFIFSSPPSGINYIFCDENYHVDLNVEPASNTSTCNGVVNTVITGGIPPYTVTFSNSSTALYQNDLCAGLYSVDIEDSLGTTKNIAFIVPDSANIYYGNPSYTPVDTLMASAFVNCAIDFSMPIDTIYIDSIVNLTPQLIQVTYIIIQDTSTYEWTETYYTDTAGYYCFVTNIYCTMRSSSNLFTAYLFGQSSGFIGITEASTHVTDLKVYPNPFNSTVKFELDNSGKASQYSMVIYDETGRAVATVQGKLVEGKCLIDLNLSNLKTGFYFAHLSTNDGNVRIRKIIRN